MSEMATSRPLAGRRIVVTRPVHQAQALARLIEAAGGRPLLFPAIEIREVDDPRPFLDLVDRLDAFDLAVFISPNAVNRAIQPILERRALPPRLKVAAIGGASVKALAGYGVSGVIAPRERYDSEALLELPELAQPAGMRVAIFRGQGGRELLGETLSARGAQVEYGECYRRGRPELDPAPLLAAWSNDELHAVTVTSSDGLRNLFEMVGGSGRGHLLRTPLFAPHPRIAETARGLAFEKVIVTGPGDEGLLAGLIAFFSARAEKRG
ncbi:MAG: uroporphyrinogen III synthase [Betaproteobacteria bacterium RIFCSPLOWO2_02_FULL_67_26]|nr:MAG: uroporphyrinogen III synthase [Betaproteobacteria bacterium RIFCSPLOWO2_02_FULL_67_26]